MHKGKRGKQCSPRAHGLGLELAASERDQQANKPDDALLFDRLAQWAPEEAVCNNILVDNPATLYGFPIVG